jgi:topoisomerase IA-like protein
MKSNSKVRALTHSIKGLFGTKKANVTMLNRKDEYYRNYFFNKHLSEGIKLVADIERLTKKDAAELLMERGLSSYMGSKITEHTQNKLSAQEQGTEPEKNRFFKKIHALAVKKGIKINDIF